jgi:trigger factor
LEIKVNKPSNYQIEISVEVPEARWIDMLDRAYTQAQKDAKVDGFRRGKVPMGLIKKMFGSSIEAETANNAVDIFYKEALEREKIDPVSPGNITEIDFGEGKSFTFKALIEVMPLLEIAAFDQMATHLDVVEVTEEDLERGLDSMREERASLTPLKPEETIQLGDLIYVDMQELDAGGIPVLTHSYKRIPMEVGKNTLGFDSDGDFIGKKVGDTIFVFIDGEETQAGQPPQKVQYQIHIVEAHNKQRPEIDDEFAKSINPNFKNVEDLRHGVKGYISHQANSRAKVKMFNRLVDFLIENNRIDLPPSMLEDYLNRLFENAKKDKERLSEEEFKSHYRNYAIWNLKWFILRKNLIDQYNLQATAQDLENEIAGIAEKGGSTVNAIKEYFKDKKRLDQLQDDIEERRVLELLEKQAKITLRAINYREFLIESQK